MNTHSFRSMFSRRHLAPLSAFLLFSLVVVCGLTASTMQLSVEASVGNGRSNQLPPELANSNPEDIKKDFNDDDLKVKGQKPRGKWGFGTGVDKGQFDDASVPVAIGALQYLSGGGKYAGVTKIKRLQIKNRSPKALNSVQLRWEITYLDDPAKVLLEGTIPFANFWVEANSSQVVEIPTIYPVLLFKPLAKDGELNGRFMLRIGLQEARFADGSVWRRQGPVIGFNYPYYDPTVADRFPRLASLSLIFPSWQADPGNSRLIIRPCEAKPGWTTSAFSSMPFQETTCHDDMNVWEDLDTGQRSCGTPSPGNACYSTCNDGWCNIHIVPGGRCSPTPPPTPTPGCPQPQPAPCCEEVRGTTADTQAEYCRWDCRDPKCPPGTPFADGCYSLGAPEVCRPDYVPTMTESYGRACCPATPTPTPPQTEDDCHSQGWYWNYWESTCTQQPTCQLMPEPCEPGSSWSYEWCQCVPNYGSPVLLDVAGDGFRMTGLAGGVAFDLNSDGRPERLAWTAAGSDDAWLALDRDGDGRIGSGRELFGNFTPQPEPPHGALRNGFLALAVYDRPAGGGNSDGVIDGRDAIFASLLLWRDANHDGLSEPAELRPAALHVASISLDYKEVRRRDRHGNLFRYQAAVTGTDRRFARRLAYDVFLTAGR